MKKLLLLCWLCALVLPLGASVAPVWTTDYKAALAQAKTEKRQILLFFTGSDWCPWCKRLKAEVLSQPEFAAYAAEKLVLVEVDFPRKTELPAALKTQNDKLADKFDLKIYPTVWLLNSKGKPLGQLGYQEGGPGPFIAALRKL